MKISDYIDHTNLNVRASSQDIAKLCKEAKEYSFPAVCVSPHHVPLAKKELQDSSVHVCTVIGFPNGYHTTATKVYELKELINLGATELDVVLNLQFVQDKNWIAIKRELFALRNMAGSNIVKLIIESELLSEEEIIQVSDIACQERIDYVKTSTGFNGKASFKEVEIMHQAIKGRAKIKAAGGIRTLKDAKKYIQLGATRLGTSSGIKLVKEELALK